MKRQSSWLVGLVAVWGLHASAAFAFDGVKISEALKLDVAADGTILIGGTADAPGGSTSKDAFVAALTPAGVLSAAFGTDGVAFGRKGGSTGMLSFAYDGDKLLFTAGTTSTFGFIGRFDAQGVLEPNFGTAGTLQINTCAAPRIVRVDTGYLLFCRQGASYPTLLKLTKAGAPDTSFGASGRVQAPSGAFYMSSAYDINVVRDGNGRIVIGGLGSNARDFSLFRFQADGTVDRAFGTSNNGVAAVTHTRNFPSAALVTTNFIAPAFLGGRIWIAAGTGAAGNNYAALMTVTAEGRLDTTFGDQGLLTLWHFWSGTPPLIAAGKDGAYLFRGNRFFKINANAEPDANFGAGEPINLRHSENDYPFLNINAVFELPSGEVLVGGYGASSATSAYRSAFVAKYTAQGELDRSFGYQGFVTLAIPH